MYGTIQALLTALTALAMAGPQCLAAPVVKARGKTLTVTVPKEATTSLPAIPIVSILPIPDNMKGVSIPQRPNVRSDVAYANNERGDTPGKLADTAIPSGSTQRCKRPADFHRVDAPTPGTAARSGMVLSTVVPAKPSIATSIAVQAQASQEETSLTAEALQKEAIMTTKAMPTASAAVASSVTSSSTGNGRAADGSYDLSRKAGIAINGPAVSGDRLKEAVTGTKTSW